MLHDFHLLTALSQLLQTSVNSISTLEIDIV